MVISHPFTAKNGNKANVVDVISSMMRTYDCRWLVAVLLCLSTGMARAAYLEWEGEAASGSEMRVLPPRLVRPPPGRGTALALLATQLEVGPPRHIGHMTVFPLQLAGRWGRFGMLTLDEALARDLLGIRELETPAVSSLLVRNDARMPVFLMSGEIVLGGKQDRIVREDVLLPAGSGWINVPVYCGERERWHDSGARFRSDGTLSHPVLRGMAVEQAGQERIWGEIDRQLDGAGVHAPTRRYQEVFAHGEWRGEWDRWVAPFHEPLGSRTVGCVVMSGHRMLACDLFSDPGLFARLWPKLARSYALDVRSPVPPHPGPILLRGRRDRPLPAPQQLPEAAIRGLLERIASAAYHPAATPGVGQRWVLSGPVKGSSLEWQGTVVHASVFP